MVFYISGNEYSDGPVEQLSNDYADSGNTKQLEQFQKEFAVLKLIDHYRTYGHLVTKTNPLRDRNVVAPDLSIQNFGLSTADLNIKFEAAKSVQLPVSTDRKSTRLNSSHNSPSRMPSSA